MTVEIKTSHELSHSTMAFMATKTDSSWGTLIYEEEVTEPIFVDVPPRKLIEAACRQYGEELIARIDSAKILCGFNNKSPIAISVTNEYYFFPIHSPSNIDCSWLSHTHIRKISKEKYSSSTVLFRDGRKISVPASKGTMLNQLHRTAQFRFALEQQIKPIQQKKAIEAILMVLGYDKNIRY
ncbi:competence protein ComK [Amphibacillus sp. MSJ-3]|uniref:competence protein ComK n=1 Tax=Amphibacillus sp. MSJ-3 TaxID=2841505 RepID=UPI001C0F2398|nr:competence protein ComK [Amphibacillus sp. MSJ-3]MBU5594018.1 competence protein ComK [Amphibacillus sp. MSJ-3]